MLILKIYAIALLLFWGLGYLAQRKAGYSKIKALVSSTTATFFIFAAGGIAAACLFIIFGIWEPTC